MIENPGLMLSLAAFFLVIGPLIFVHELGHYLAGRVFGVHADAFSIGFGRELFGWTDRRGTRWKVGWLPMGGYVKFAGDMNPASTPDPEWLKLPAAEQARTFQAKPLWQRFIIVAAGPITNFLFAIAIFAGFFTLYGEPRTPPVASMVVAGSPAERAGFRTGDTIITVAGERIDRFEDIPRIVSIHPGERLAVEIERAGDALTLGVVPDAVVERDRFGNEFRRGMIGISPGERVIVPLAPLDVIGASISHTADIVRTMVSTLSQIITGRRSVKELGGPVQIAKFSGQQVVIGWASFIEFMAMISINLGFINLLPIPLLDGGHLFFYALEAVRRRPIDPKVQEWAFRSGLALLLTFMIFVTFNDLGSLGFWERLAGLIG